MQNLSSFLPKTNTFHSPMPANCSCISENPEDLKKKYAEFDSVLWNDVETTQKKGITRKGQVQAPEGIISALSDFPGEDCTLSSCINRH